MKSFCTIGLILLGTMVWAAGTTHAQMSTFGPTLLPPPGVQRTGYYTDPAGDSHGTLYNPSTTTGYKSEFDAALHSPACDECGSCMSCNPCGCGCKWYGGAALLFMGRNRANPYWTSYETNNNPNQLMNTQNAGADWAVGGQLTVGYAWCGCGGPSLAFTYWGLGPMEGFSSVTNPNTVSTPIDLGGVVMNNGFLASQYFDNAAEHRIWRDDYVNNFEINALTGVYQVGIVQMAALAGFRYFRLGESLLFGSLADGFTWGQDNGLHEAYLRFRTINNLYGAQVGALLNAQVTDSFSIFLIPKVGIYGNQMNCQTLLYSGEEFNNPTYNIAAHKTDISMLSEIDAGFAWAFAYNWRAFIGYRVVGVNNVALADNQFLPYLADTDGFAQVKQSGSVILHGAFVGLGWMF